MRTLRVMMMSLVLISLPVLAIADGCQSYPVMQPNGTMKICTQCCFGGTCRVNCI